MAMNFFVLNRYPHGTDRPYLTDFVRGEPSNIGSDAPKCEVCGRYTDLLPWLPPHCVELEAWGCAYGDFGGGTWREFLISDRLRTLIEQHGLQGLSGFDPVEVVRVRKRRPVKGVAPAYFLVRPRRNGAVVDEVASELERAGRPTCPHCGGGDEVFRYRRLILRDGSWGGDDVFAPNIGRVIMVTEQFKLLCEQAQLRNLVFAPADSELAGMDGSPRRNLKRANELMSLPLSDVLWEKTLRDGRVVPYYTPINEVVIRETDGRLVMTRPFGGRKFWDELE